MCASHTKRVGDNKKVLHTYIKKNKKMRDKGNFIYYLFIYYLFIFYLFIFYYYWNALLHLINTKNYSYYKTKPKKVAYISINYKKL